MHLQLKADHDYLLCFRLDFMPFQRKNQKLLQKKDEGAPILFFCYKRFGLRFLTKPDIRKKGAPFATKGLDFVFDKV